MRIPLPVAALASKCVVAWAISRYCVPILLLCAPSVFSASLWLMIPGQTHHRDTENTEGAQRNHSLLVLRVLALSRPLSFTGALYPLKTKTYIQVSTPGLRSLTEHPNRSPGFVRVE